jgi:hypothetical protein
MREYYVNPFGPFALFTLSLNVTDNCAAVSVSVLNNLWYHAPRAAILYPVDLMLTLR